MAFRFCRKAFVLAVLAACGGVPQVQADIITLSGGGELRGRIKPGDDSAGEIAVTTPAGTTVVVPRAQVRSIVERPFSIEEYESRARLVADDVDSQWQLAEWCRLKGLDDQRRIHLERILELDPNHVAAHRGLGHIQHEGQWTSRDELMQAHGYVKYKGKFVPPQEREIRQQQDAVREAEADWHKKIRQLHGWLTGPSAERSQFAMAELRKIVDPDAVYGLARVFADHDNPQLRALFVGILAQIPGPQAATALVNQSLFDVDSSIRENARMAITPSRFEFALPLFLAALKHEQNIIVRRAAISIEAIGDKAAIPHLIDALVTVHKYRVQINDDSGTYSFGADGSLADPNSFVLPPEIEMQLRTGQLPYGVIVIPPNRQFSRPRTRIITIERAHQNSEVLSALQSLTGESFGYDKSAWGLWISMQKSNPAALPVAP